MRWKQSLKKGSLPYDFQHRKVRRLDLPVTEFFLGLTGGLSERIWSCRRFTVPPAQLGLLGAWDTTVQYPKDGIHSKLCPRQFSSLASL